MYLKVLYYANIKRSRPSVNQKEYVYKLKILNLIKLTKNFDTQYKIQAIWLY